MRKKNGKWRGISQGQFSSSRIDQLVDSAVGHKRMSFLDTYSSYHQIPLLDPDQENTTFITTIDLYCYKVIPFGLKKASATYQRLVTKMFRDEIGKSMEVYMVDMLVKRKKGANHIVDLGKTFNILKHYKMKLNAVKCTFGVCSGKFLGFMVNNRRIEANPEKR